MPEKSETIPVTGRDRDSILSIAYGTFENLGWDLRTATENSLTAFTPRSWNAYEQRVVVKASDNQFEISSKLIYGESLDIYGKNKKNIRQFVLVFELVNTSGTEEDIDAWRSRIADLREKTVVETKDEVHAEVPVGKIMELPKGRPQLTIGIIAVNVLVFVAMIVSGVNLFAPSALDILKWGANFGPLTFSGEWWRLITCTFIHIGIVHIAFNMYALYMIGVYLEPMLGKIKFALAYLCTGIFASITSLWWHDLPTVSAGASGAIFGMYGVFLALLTTSLVPKDTRSRLLTSIGIFVGYNLLYGLKDNVDNSAHVGGLLSGMGVGYGYYYMIREKTSPVVKQAAAAILVACAVFFGFLFYSMAKNASMRNLAIQQFQSLIQNAKTPDIDSSPDTSMKISLGPPRILSLYVLQKIDAPSSLYDKEETKKMKSLLDDFIPKEEEAVDIYDEPGSKTMNERIERLRSHCLGTWRKAAKQFDDAASYHFSSDLDKIRRDLVKYCKLQERKAELLIKFYSEPYGDYNSEMNRGNEELESFTAKVWRNLQR
ncbi:MAG TPA: rhomboid family intramembrane serine protease [Chitinophagaceae bacterium]|nr:rhomboid family intramembrane serine protease [Chitinophagaceae bacterium]